MTDPQPRGSGRHALVLLLTGAVVISFSPVFVKLADVGPMTAGFYRMSFGGVPLAVWLLWRRRAWWGGWRHFLLSAGCGVLLAFDLSLWHGSIGYIGPGLATILANFQVFFVAAFAVVVLKETLAPRVALAIPLAVAGLFLIFGLEWSSVGRDYRVGFGLGLLAAAFYAAYLMTLRQARIDGARLAPAVTVATLSLVTAAVLAGTIAAGPDTFRIPDGRTLGVLLGYGVGPQLAGWLLISRGLPGVAASRVGLVLLLQPALAFGWDTLFFARPTTPLELAGAALALVAIYLGAVEEGQEAKSAM